MWACGTDVLSMHLGQTASHLHNYEQCWKANGNETSYQPSPVRERWVQDAFRPSWFHYHLRSCGYINLSQTLSLYLQCLDTREPGGWKYLFSCNGWYVATPPTRADWASGGVQGHRLEMNHWITTNDNMSWMNRISLSPRLCDSRIQT